MEPLSKDHIDIIKYFCTQSLMECAREKSDFLARAHVTVNDKENVLFVPFKNSEEKKFVFMELGKFLFENNAHQTILIADTYIRTFENKKDFKYASDNWDTERPTMYPEKLRKSALVITAIDFKDKDKEQDLLLPYTVEYGKVTFEEEKSSNDKSKEGISGYGGYIRDLIAVGLARAFLEDYIERNEITSVSAKKIFESESKTLEMTVKIKSEIKEEYPNLVIDLDKKFGELMQEDNINEPL